MDKDKFWSIIEQSLVAGKASEDAQENQENALRELLEILPLGECATFSIMFHQYMIDAYRWDLWAAGYLLNDYGCSEDFFMDFRAWVISRGRTVFENALENPDTLADQMTVDGCCSFEGFLYVHWQIYEKRSGQRLKYPSQLANPAKPEWKDLKWDDLDVMSKYLPIICQKLRG